MNSESGSCNIGFKPKPSDGIGEILLKGFELKRIKKGTKYQNILNYQCIKSKFFWVILL